MSEETLGEVFMRIWGDVPALEWEKPHCCPTCGGWRGPGGHALPFGMIASEAPPRYRRQVLVTNSLRLVVGCFWEGADRPQGPWSRLPEQNPDDK